MDYLIEAKKFIERAREAHCPEVIETDLEMAVWFLYRAIEERDDTPVKSQTRDGRASEAQSGGRSRRPNA